jgi:hypothetical protein
MNVEQDKDSIKFSDFECTETVKQLSSIAVDHECDVQITHRNDGSLELIVYTFESPDFLNAILKKAADMLGIK